MEMHISKIVVPNEGTRAYELRMRAFGSAVFDRQVMKNAYVDHNNDVVNFFINRTGDLLVLDVSDDDKWLKLCGFLGCVEPDLEYPKANVASMATIKKIANPSNI
jgi:hypothetical protein